MSLPTRNGRSCGPTPSTPLRRPTRITRLVSSYRNTPRTAWVSSTSPTGTSIRPRARALPAHQTPRRLGGARPLRLPRTPRSMCGGSSTTPIATAPMPIRPVSWCRYSQRTDSPRSRASCSSVTHRQRRSPSLTSRPPVTVLSVILYLWAGVMVCLRAPSRCG